MDGGDGASIDLSIHTYIHTYIHIYIYTRRYWWMHLDTRYIARRQQSTLLPPALAPLARTSLCPVVAPRWGLTPVPGDHSGPPPTGQYPGLPPLHGDRPRERSARPWPTANWRERVSPATVARARARPQSSQSPSANWPTPRTPSIPSIRPHAHGPRLPALASSTAALVPPGRARMRWPRATVPVQQRRRRATAPAAWPRDAPTRRPAHRLSHRLSGPRRAPLVRANAPVSGDDSRGKGRAPKVGHLVWSIHLRLPTGRLTARVPRQGRSPG